MATDLSLWTLDDCIKYVQQNVQSLKPTFPDSFMETIFDSFRRNHVSGPTLLRFTDDEWKELIPPIGLRIHIRDAFKKVIREDEKAAQSQLHCKGLPKQHVEEKAQLVPYPRITSFFSKSNVLELPDEDSSLSVHEEPTLPAETVSIVNLENISEFIQYILTKRESNFTPLL